MTGAQSQIRVMIVDDSVVIRGFLSRYLHADPAIQIVASVSNGDLALSTISRREIDVVILDIEMPVMDGLTALPKILEMDPCIQVIMASTLTKKNAAVTLQAMHMGAAECLAKPSTAKDMNAAEDFQHDLVSKTLALGRRAQMKRQGHAHAGNAERPRSSIAHLPVAGVRQQYQLQAPGFPGKPDVLAIGSSTGGPQALLGVLSALRPGFGQPLFITQHMPATFTSILAEHLHKHCGIACMEAVHGEIVTGGRAYIAPGSFHMTVAMQSGARHIVLNQDPPENFCRPAVDPMLRSLVRVYGRKIFTLILTGMGVDGMKGCQEVVKAGGVVVAQDEASSVVWGMPGAVTNAGLCSRVLPLDQLGPFLKKVADNGIGMA